MSLFGGNLSPAVSISRPFLAGFQFTPTTSFFIYFFLGGVLKKNRTFSRIGSSIHAEEAVSPCLEDAAALPGNRVDGTSRIPISWNLDETAVVKNRYPKWHPGKWKQSLKPVVPWWFHFDPYSDPGRNPHPLAHGPITLHVLLERSMLGPFRARVQSSCPVDQQCDQRIGSGGLVN